MIREVTVLGRRLLVKGDPRDTYLSSLPGDVDDDVLSLLGKIVRSDVVAVDVGANLGIHALALSHLAPEGHVYAFEANPDTARHLEENVRTNEARNVTVDPRALSSEPGELTLFSNDEFAAGSTPVDRASEIARDSMVRARMGGNEEPRGRLIRVPATTLDVFLAERGLDRLDLVKIDVEGSDIDVLRGAAEALRMHRPVVIMEFASFAIMAHRQLLPVDVLEEIRKTFDRVFVVERGGMLRELTGDSEAWDLLWENANVRPVQDLIGIFESSRLSDSVRALAAQRGGTALPPPEPSPMEVALREALAAEEGRAAHLEEQLEEQRDTVAELRETIDRLEGSVADLEAEQAELQRTVSWRITRPLRAVRRLFPPKGSR